MTQENDRELKLELGGMKRNPYLVDYREGRRNAKKDSKAYVTNGKYRRDARRRARIRRRQIYILRLLIMLAVVIGVLSIFILLIGRIVSVFTPEEAQMQPESQEVATDSVVSQETVQGISITDYCRHPSWTEDFLTPNEYSRPGDSLQKVNNIFVHYTGNQGTSAAQNRSYFEQLKDTHERSASAHFIIGYEGEIIQCVPLDEIAYAVQTRNEDSISIECCYLAEDGSFTQETYDSLILLLRWLIETYDLDAEDILRHYDCGGKKCPIYYTENEDAWEQLKEDVKTL